MREPTSQLWGEEWAEDYDRTSAAMFAPEVLDPTVEFLLERACPEPAGSRAAVCEFAVGTGRVAIALAARGVEVTGIELSEPMLTRLRAKDPHATVRTVAGDMATTQLPQRFSLVYLVFNTISNLLTQDAQVACFANAARHLLPGGAFVVELGVPDLRRLPPGAVAVPFDIGADHLGFDTYDLREQRLTSQHYHRRPDGGFHHLASEHRYAWPAELDLMARLAGMSLTERYAGFTGDPFTAESPSHVSVWRTPGAPLR